MNTVRLGFRLLGRYLHAYWPTLLFCLGLFALFPMVHLLGFGQLRELGYALFLSVMLLLAGFLFTFCRFVIHQLALWKALERLPSDPSRLPPARTPTENDYRKLALAYSREARQQADEAATAELTRTDYYTLWIHQIKTPIAAMNLIAQSETPIDRKQLRQELFKVERYAEAALTFQRLSSIREDLALEMIPLYPLCCKIVRKLRPLFQYRNILLRLEPFDGSALTDEKWLGMALEQVLTNALKYTPEGGQIEIALMPPQVLTISDTGIGIRPEDVPRVFHRGFTGYAGRSEEKSTGIGLYLCKQACDLLGHKVSLCSELGKGTCVTFDLHRREAPHEE